ncbi:hypothetical protein C8Q80DRAFT_670079 [Daedaleopsis nitida]|nr:hypothetical protein C8Q80DRAFT_670079 [Daedaleopsis nitida]
MHIDMDSRLPCPSRLPLIRIVSALLMFPLLVLIASGLGSCLPGVAGQDTNATCSPEFDWMFNSKGQSPCLISSYLFTPCAAPADTFVFPLGPGQHYATPVDEPTSANPCRCNTVLFSTIAACATCQGGGDYIVPWPTYSQNCSSPGPFIEEYPEDIPSGTAVPAWAYLDIRLTDNTFSVAAAQEAADQDLPESTAPAIPSPTSQVTVNSVATSQSTPASSPSIPLPQPSDSQTSSAQKSSNVGTIVAGLVGSLIGCAGVGVAVFFYLRYRRLKRAHETSSGPSDASEWGAHPPSYGEKLFTKEAAQLLASQKSRKLYNPNDPTTFPQSMGSDSVNGSVDVALHPDAERGASPFGNHGYLTSTGELVMGPARKQTYPGIPEL